jgi:transcriptional regulator with XRE-family HTH domain
MAKAGSKSATKKATPRYKTVAAKLRSWREAMGPEWTQEKVAAICGVALRTVQSWEQGLRRPGKSVDLYLLSDAYGVTVEQVEALLGGGNRG